LVYDIQSQTTTNPGSAESIIRVAIDGNNVAYVYRTTSDAVVLVGDVGTRLFAENWSNVSQLFLTSSYLLWNADGSTYLHRIDANDTTVLSDVGLYDLDGENIVWYENLGGSLADQVFIYNIITGQKHQITEYPNKGLKPKISGQYVVWYGHSSGEVDTDIFLYDIGTDTTTKLTYNEYDERNPDICGDIVAWSGRPGDGPGTDIFLYDISTTDTKRVSYSPLTNSVQLVVSESTIVWVEQIAGVSSSVYAYDTGRARFQQLGTYPPSSAYPRVSGKNITWLGVDGNDHDLFIAYPRPDVCGDFGGEYGTDFEDYAILADAWSSGETDAKWNELCDLVPNGFIDMADVSEFCFCWLLGK
jgi:hypothetical protein